MIDKLVYRAVLSGMVSLLAIFLVLAKTSPSLAGKSPCVLILHDQDMKGDDGVMYPVFLANLLGHWPKYGVRVSSVFSYRKGQVEQCHATIYIGISEKSVIPRVFIDDFIATSRRVAWLGHGLKQLGQTRMREYFGHRIAGMHRMKNGESDTPSYYQYVLYKGQVFREKIARPVYVPAYDVLLLEPASTGADGHVMARLQHSITGEQTPFILRSGNKFVVTRMPFSYLGIPGAYQVVADVLFDILGEEPYRKKNLALARIEDVHSHYDMAFLSAVLMALTEENVPLTISHIPMFMDPGNKFGKGVIATPEAATENAVMKRILTAIGKDDRNAIIWHGVTHQFEKMDNPYNAISGYDYEFWDINKNTPVPGSSRKQVTGRLAWGISVFQAYNIKPRYWVTPHYHASAVANKVFGEAFPWTVGRTIYYGSSFGPEFTLAATDRLQALRMKAPDKKSLHELSVQKPSGNGGTDTEKSRYGVEQIFPYEIYRDVYGQRIIPETLYYVSLGSSDSDVRTVEDMLEDAGSQRVLRDFWASFFFHPYLVAAKKDGGLGRFSGDTLQLRKLVHGLRALGYSFIGLPEFERRLRATGKSPARNAKAALLQEHDHGTVTGKSENAARTVMAERKMQ